MTIELLTARVFRANRSQTHIHLDLSLHLLTFPLRERTADIDIVVLLSILTIAGLAGERAARASVRVVTIGSICVHTYHYASLSKPLHVTKPRPRRSVGMKDQIEIGSSPGDEPCAQLGVDPDYEIKARHECKRYIDLIRQACGVEPTGARLTTKWSNHDFGRYAEVVCTFDDAFPDAVEYAYRVESEAPAHWPKDFLTQ